MMDQPWRFAQDRGFSAGGFEVKLQAGPWQARVDVRHPEAGVFAVRVADAEFPARSLLAAEAARAGQALTVADHYIRGDDLVATYQQEAQDVLRPQIYWRLIPEGRKSSAHSSRPSLGIELIVSMQTGLLHSEPACAVTSELPAAEVWRMAEDEAGRFQRVEAAAGAAVASSRADGSGVLLARCLDERFSFVQMVYPSDFHQLTVTFPASGPDSVKLVHQLFPESLEKGVIRRGRVRGWIIDRSDDFAQAAELYRRWLVDPPPLTT